jgi:hypothetical protein
MKIAMWSGPRNLSTAMMYSFGNRNDFTAMDEPFYAAFLKRSGMSHPMRDKVLAHQTSDPNAVAMTCAKTPKHHTYMKHMAHHMLDDFPLDWAFDCVNIHLLRHPARVLASYALKREHVTLEDIGYPQQLHVFNTLGGLVINSSDIRANPELALRKLCKRIDLDFDTDMLRWNAGPRSFDGIWASHWYGAVHSSVGFASDEGPMPDVPQHLQPLLKSALPIYEQLANSAVGLLTD